MATTTSSMAHACDRARNWVAERTSTHGALDALRSARGGGEGGLCSQNATSADTPQFARTAQCAHTMPSRLGGVR